MRLLFGFVLCLGIGLAGFAVYMAQDRIGQYQSVVEEQRQKLEENVPLETVFVTTRALSYGELLAEEDVKEALFPVDSIPKGAFQDMAVLFSEDPDETRFVLRRVEAGEVLMDVKVTRPGENAGFASLLEPGMRAFAIKVDVATGVAGFVRPDDRVDVYWSASRNTEFEGGLTKLIATNVQVIAVDQRADKDQANPQIARTVTVAVAPQQVAALTQAQNSGKLTLSLVGTSDNSVAQVVDVDQNTLLGVQAEQVVSVEKTRICTISTRKGVDVIKIPIPCSK